MDQTFEKIEALDSRPPWHSSTTRVPWRWTVALTVLGLVLLGAALQSSMSASADAGPVQVTGRLVDADGAPVRGSVILYDEGLERRTGAASDVDGNFVIGIVAPGRYRVQVGPIYIGPGPDVVEPVAVKYLPDAATLLEGVPIDVPADEATDLGTIVVQRPGLLSGVVSDRDGAPIEGIEVGGGVTGADGTYSVHLAPPPRGTAIQLVDPTGRYRGEFYSDVQTFGDATPIVVGLDEQMKLDFVLDQWGVFSGTVVDVNGAPIADVVVTATSEDTVRTATTGVDGSYELFGLIDGSYVVQFSDPLGRHVSSFYGGSTLALATQVSSGLNQSTSSIDAVMSTGSFGGTAVKATVWVYDLDGHLVDRADSGVHGTFLLPNLPIGTYAVFAQALDFNASNEWYDNVHESRLDRTGAVNVGSATPVEFLGGSHVRLDVEFDPEGRIEGFVLDEDGVGAKEVLVTATATDGTTRFARTGSTGRYLLWADPGPHILSFDGGLEYGSTYFGGQSQESATPVRATPRSVTGNIDVTVMRRGSLAGTVVDDLGNPVHHVRIVVHPGEKTAGTDVNGNFRVTDLDPGTYEVLAERSHGQRHLPRWHPSAVEQSDASQVLIGPGAQVVDVDIVVPTGHIIMGTVVDIDGQPLGGVNVIAAPSGQTSITRSDGSYEVVGLESGAHTVSFGVGSKEYVPLYYPNSPDPDAAVPVLVGPGSATDPVDAIVQRYGRISGTIHSLTGSRVESSHVTGWIDGEACCVERLTWENFYELIVKTPGPVKVHVAPPRAFLPAWYGPSGTEDGAVEVVVGHDEVVSDIDFHLTSSGYVRGRLVNEEGVPVSNVIASVIATDGTIVGQSLTSSTGGYWINLLPPGDHIVRFSGMAGFADRYHFDATDAAGALVVRVNPGLITPDVDGVVPISGVITGRVHQHFGAFFGGVEVRVIELLANSDRALRAIATTRDDGVYFVGGLTDGEYLLEFDAGPEFVPRPIGDGSTAVPVSVMGGVTSSIRSVVMDKAPELRTMSVNFQPANAPIPEGWSPDAGRPFDVDAGYGWRLPSGGVPERRQCGDRNVLTDQVLDTFCHAQARYRRIDGSWLVTDAPAIWEAAVPNGTYEVTVTMGESRHRSKRVVNSAFVEGVGVVDSFTADTTNSHATGTVTVSVADGMLTIDPTTGSRGKLASVVIEPSTSAPVEPVPPTPGGDDPPLPDESEPPEDDGDPAPDEPFETALINFQSGKASTPTGWARDVGFHFDDAKGFGWIGVDGGSVRPRQCGDRDATNNQALDTFCHAQTRYEFFNGTWRAIDSPALWELEVPNGNYNVTVTMGESRHAFSSVSNSIDVEGVRVIDGFAATTSDLFRTATRVITVSDGRLTLDPTLGARGKITSVVVEAVAN